ncbi:uncharacterized protein LOC111602709 [Drosophila hydei]|uniref:Uncharacterized protein LOC111602709 n=1 Tax=Drosophila hydei TaxID=7224 RepID=A0A6J1M8Z8_DROHY|nr:uncharacterized protein LOC111602709 [Drosophila hydei]
MEFSVFLLLFLPLLSSFCCVSTMNDATASTTRLRKNATETRAQSEAFNENSSRVSGSRGHKSRTVAQYKLPLYATETAPDSRDTTARSQSMRRRTQVVMRRRPTTTSTTTTTTTTTTTSTTPRPVLANGFNFFHPSFWSFGQQSLVPVSSPTKQPHPPKKFTHSTATGSKEEKSTYRRQQKTTPKPRRKANTTMATSTTEGPFRLALPTLNFPSTAAGASDKEKDKRAAADLRQRFNCPRENEVRFQLFPKICKSDKDCLVWQRDEICCDIFGSSSCVAGIAKPLEETEHAPILGLIPRKCPTRPLAELWWDVQECLTDMDCWPRVCCPDGRRRYCRTSQPELETVPVPVKRSFDYLTEYLECTAPPPTIFDLHPKACTSTLDCFPNVCCQEAGLRHCRPPKKSVLTLMANFLNVDFVKRLTQNIVIK